MKISVIIPVYNCEEYIETCVRSVLAQTHTDLEIICVNDGSKDRSGEILDQLAKEDSRIQVIHQNNAGVTRARLKGVKRAIGEYIGFVDGDDTIEPKFYELLLANALKYSAQISHCGYQMIFKDGRIHFFHNTGHLLTQNKTTALRDLLSGEIIEPGLWNKLFHKALFYNLVHENQIDETIKINEDLLMNFYLFSAAETFVFEDCCPYHYIVHEGSVSRSTLNQNQIYDPIKVKKIILSAIGDELQKEAQCAYVNTCINIYNMLLFAGTEYQNDLRRVRNLIKYEKESFYLLRKKRATMARMIVRIPVLYKMIYKVYSRYFKINVYS